MVTADNVVTDRGITIHSEAGFTAADTPSAPRIRAIGGASARLVLSPRVRHKVMQNHKAPAVITMPPRVGLVFATYHHQATADAASSTTVATISDTTGRRE